MASIHENDLFPIAPNLPDMTCADFLRSVALMCSATFDIDETAKTIELKTLDGVIENYANATDLSNCIEESIEPENAVILDGYAQANKLKWKALEDKSFAGYGDGVIKCDAQNIPLSVDLFEMPFSATVDSSVTIGGYGNPVLVETRTVTGSGTNLQVNAKSTTPRLLLAEPSKMVTVTVNQVTPDLTVVKRNIQLMACWWDQRPTPIQFGNNGFSLAFDRPSLSNGREQTLIQRYFDALKRVLRRPRGLTISAYLRPSVLSTLDMYAPVRLQNVNAGSLYIKDNFFYLNKIANYRAGVPCSLVLIAY